MELPPGALTSMAVGVPPLESPTTSLSPMMMGAVGMPAAMGMEPTGSPSMLDAAVRHAGLEKLFNMVLSVEDVGIYKPSRRVYRHAMQKLQIHDAPAICFVTSNTWDAAGAAQFGFQVVRVDRFGLKDDRIPGKPARMIKDLSELAGLV